MPKQIIRITLFKIPLESDIEAALAKYSTLQGTAVKVINSTHNSSLANCSLDRSYDYLPSGSTTQLVSLN